MVNLGLVYRDSYQFETAESLFHEAKTYTQQYFGKEHAKYVYILNVEAILFRRKGEFDRAEELYLESLSLREKIYGKEHNEYALALVNLGNLYTIMARFEKAEPLYLEALAIRVRVLGKEHQHYALSLHNLAAFYMYVENYASALPMLLEALDIRMQDLGADHPQVAQNRMNLAMCYLKTGNSSQAEAQFQEAQTIYEQDSVQHQVEYAQCLYNLANLYLDQQQVTKAQPLLEKAESIYRESLGPDHPDYAVLLTSLGLMARVSGKPGEAEQYHRDAAQVLNSTVGPNHLYTIDNLSDLVSLYVHTGQFKKAEPLFKDLFEGLQTLVSRAAMHLSERELAQYIHTSADNLNLSLSQVHQAPNGALAAICYNNSLFYKGYLLQAINQVQRLARKTPETAELFEQIKASRRRLSQQYTRPLSQRQGITTLEEEANRLEKQLTRQVAGWGQTNQQVVWSDIRDALTAGEAAIEFVDFQREQTGAPTKAMVAALIIRPQDKHPIYVPLTPKESLDSLLLFHAERRGDFVNALYAIDSRGLVADGPAQRTLLELIWNPLSDHLVGVDRVYYSPSGLLHRINLGAIPVDDLETLADRITWIQVNSTRQLVHPSFSQSKDHTIALFGDIDYEVDESYPSEEAWVAMRSSSDREKSAEESTARGGQWNRLPSTGREIRSIATLAEGANWHISSYWGSAATEVAYKKLGSGELASPQVIHLATHGYFFDVPDHTTASADKQTSIFQRSANPMVRSGLILAGGNPGWRAERSADGQEDGVLTAYEISQMDLSQTELVVLSACETGLGDIQGNEGVYGLQRAFKIAGVHYMIMSLWQVPDRQTSLLMTTFYRNWLEEGMTIPEAFRSAQAQLREMGFDPWQWAGFVLVE